MENTKKNTETQHDQQIAEIQLNGLRLVVFAEKGKCSADDLPVLSRLFHEYTKGNLKEKYCLLPEVPRTLRNESQIQKDGQSAQKTDKPFDHHLPNPQCSCKRGGNIYDMY
jgi:hypothetical protein